ncbi:hypothetical protein G7046_g1817 [Stylonectria norvegica]|nr:hypothetical protein G7046_g1817 [Stylonectria norvegica]
MYIFTLLRRATEPTGHGLGLGWLLAIALGGAVLIFTCVGFLLAWRIKNRPQGEQSAPMYQVPSSDDHPRRVPTKRLTKRKYLLAESTSRLSLSLPPVLPPLPSYHSFKIFGRQGSRGRSRSWVEEDKFHGPKINRNAQDAWFSRDSWLGRVPPPTLPMMLDDAEKGEADNGPEQIIQVQKRTSVAASTTVVVMAKAIRPALQQSKTAPELTDQEDESRGRVMIPVPPRLRPSITDTDLSFILQSTEQRLREGTSISPTKTSRSSPLKRSPTKTPQPRSHRTGSSQGSIKTDATVRIVSRTTPSPSKKTIVQSTTPQTQPRNASVGSVGSAANSLIAEATQELEQPGGLSSPSRMRNGLHWDTEDDATQDDEGRPRSKSIDSNASSSLSTLYSVGEPEEKRTEPNEEDPFVEKDGARSSSMEHKQSLFGPRSLRKRTNTLSAVSPSRSGEHNRSAVPSPLRGLSAQAMDNAPVSIYLQPPPEPSFCEDVNPKGSRGDQLQLQLPLALPESFSGTSMVTPSVTTVGDDDDEDNDTIRIPSSRTSGDVPKDGWFPPKDGKGYFSRGQPSPSTTMASSPYDEQDMLSMLMSSSSPRRGLPDIPMHVSHVDSSSTSTTPLQSPRPTRDISVQVRNMSTASSTSSNYVDNSYVDGSSLDDPSIVSTGSPSRRPAVRPSAGPAAAVHSRCLRRLHDYRRRRDSPTLPALRGGGFSPSRSVNKTGTIGRQNYLNLASASPSSRASRQRSKSQPKRVGLGIEILDEGGKENVGPEGKASRPEVFSGLREGRRSGNQRRESGGGKTKLGPVTEHKREAEQKTLDSPGLYDGDGFLRSSPETRRYLRM